METRFIITRRLKNVLPNATFRHIPRMGIAYHAVLHAKNVVRRPLIALNAIVKKTSFQIMIAQII